MKKTLLSVLAASLVLGNSAPTSAVSNPFADVPADHWAYDAVAQLAADGVIEGYGDGTYRGDQEITRYEMAQMIARAMTRGAKGTDKALIDKLAAEFADELNNLGVRVASLEKRVDNVKWLGRLRYRYNSKKHEGEPSANVNQVLLRLEPNVKINEHWTGKARIDYRTDMNSAANTTTSTLDRVYAQGIYGDTVINLGKLWYPTQADYGLVLDGSINGGQVSFGKDVKVSLAIGRYNLNTYRDFGATAGGADTVGYQAIEIYNDRTQKFTWGVGYHHLKNDRYLQNLYGNDDANIWAAGIGYKFTPNISLTASYAKNTSGDIASKYRQAYIFALNYKGARANDAGSFGVTVNYRHFGQYATLHPTYDIVSMLDNTRTIKGWEAGFSYAFAKNIVGSAYYFRGKSVNDTGDKDYSNIFTEVNFFF